jgi:putative membrane protein insertion efficiency factor
MNALVEENSLSSAVDPSPSEPPGRMVRAMTRAIRGYQLARTGRPTGCRYLPSCSEYAVEAIERHGALRGGALAARRLARCTPWGGHGVDPVPDRRTACTHP